MTTNTRIKVSDLDFNEIRDNLKTYLQGQSTFTDYNFDGSALSVLLDVLAYNTHYNALYTNLAVNEMFLDSASKRSSVISIAHNYAYTPRSKTAAKAKVNVVVTVPGGTAQFKTLPKFSSFTSTYDGITYNFYTLQDYSAARVVNASASVYTFENVEIYQGYFINQLFVCTEEDQKFILPNSNIDTKTIELTIQETSEQPDYEKYELVSGVLDLNENSKVYYLKELENFSYQIYFGRNGLGKPLLPGNIVTVTYLITNAADANGASSFAYNGVTLGGVTTVTTISVAAEGALEESVEEIKYNVAKSFYDQNRAVTTGDYISLLKRTYTDIESISVWGGEDNDPIQYGKVFLAIKPASKPYLTPSDKAFIKSSIIKSRNIVSITPEIVDPTYIEMEINSTVYYNKNSTTRSQGQLVDAVSNAIINYRNLNLRKFDGVFRMSKFAAAIDAVDQSIQSNITTFKLWNQITPKYDIFAEYRLNLGNPIYTESVPEEAFKSNGFYIDSSDIVHYLDDDGIGNVRLYNIITGTGNKIIVNPSIGRIDYEKGIVTITGLKITNIAEGNFYFIIKTESYDVISSRSQIIDIPASRVFINTVQDNTATGMTPNVSNYTFTSSRA